MRAYFKIFEKLKLKLKNENSKVNLNFKSKIKIFSQFEKTIGKNNEKKF